MSSASIGYAFVFCTFIYQEEGGVKVASVEFRWLRRRSPLANFMMNLYVSPMLSVCRSLCPVYTSRAKQ